MPPFLSSIPLFAWLAPIIMLWGQIKSTIQSLVRLVIREVQVSGSASEAVAYYLRKEGKRLPTNVIKFSSVWLYVKKRGGHKMVLFEGVKEMNNMLYWYEKTIVAISDKRGQDKETGIFKERLVSLRYLRGTLDVEDLLRKAVEWHEKREERVGEVTKFPRFFVKRFVGVTGGNYMTSPSFSPEKAVAPPTSAEEDWRFSRLLHYSVDDLGYAGKLFFHVFNENAKRVLEDVKRWSQSKTWYEERGLLHRRGALLWGQPGSGKSSLIRKVGQSLDLPVFIFELSTMTNDHFLKYWEEARQQTPCIIVMEDIDTVFKKREPANVNIKLSFECLLNGISGVEPAEGVYLFVTTNRLEHLDEALGVPDKRGISTRPGRLDTCFEMGGITLVEKQEMANHFLKDYPDEGASIIETSNGCTAAQFSDMCAQKALELYWGTKA